jgi:hypothetical protein|nr:MAG TPA: hypothetical protein [Caudoviricetes sp.]
MFEKFWSNRYLKYYNHKYQSIDWNKITESYIGEKSIDVLRNKYSILDNAKDDRQSVYIQSSANGVNYLKKVGVSNDTQVTIVMNYIKFVKEVLGADDVNDPTWYIRLKNASYEEVKRYCVEDSYLLRTKRNMMSLIENRIQSNQTSHQRFHQLFYNLTVDIIKEIINKTYLSSIVDAICYIICDSIDQEDVREYDSRNVIFAASKFGLPCSMRDSLYKQVTKILKYDTILRTCLQHYINGDFAKLVIKIVDLLYSGLEVNRDNHVDKLNQMGVNSILIFHSGSQYKAIRLRPICITLSPKSHQMLNMNDRRITKVVRIKKSNTVDTVESLTDENVVCMLPHHCICCNLAQHVTICSQNPIKITQDAKCIHLCKPLTKFDDFAKNDYYNLHNWLDLPSNIRYNGCIDDMYTQLNYYYSNEDHKIIDTITLDLSSLYKPFISRKKLAQSIYQTLEDYCMKPIICMKGDYE